MCMPQVYRQSVRYIHRKSQREKEYSTSREVWYVQTKLVTERRGSVTKNEGSNSGSPFRSDRGTSQQSSSDLDKSLMQVSTLLQPMYYM